MQIVKLDSVESTNRYCELLDLTQVEEFTCFWTVNQTAGVGQRGNKWVSTAGESLTFSLILKPHFLAADRQFALTQVLSLAVRKSVAESIGSNEVYIKWPNDVYIGNRKVCGMLIANRLHGTNMGESICGIGLNVRQKLFGEGAPNATSLALHGAQIGVEEMLHHLLNEIEDYYSLLRLSETDPSIQLQLQEEYLSHLFLKDQQQTFIYLSSPIQATIRGVDRYGRLCLTTASGEEICCNLKEIVFPTLNL